MKTQIYKWMAITVISVLTLSINAQNTKKYSLNRYYAEQLLENIRNYDMLSAVSEEISNRMMELAGFCKFNPKTDALAYYDPDYSASIETIASELEKDVKFRPAESLVNEMDNMKALDEVKNELKMNVKYNPSESVVNAEYETSAAFSEILSELEKDAKFHPEVLN